MGFCQLKDFFMVWTVSLFTVTSSPVVLSGAGSPVSCVPVCGRTSRSAEKGRPVGGAWWPGGLSAHEGPEHVSALRALCRGPSGAASVVALLWATTRPPSGPTPCSRHLPWWGEGRHGEGSAFLSGVLLDSPLSGQRWLTLLRLSGSSLHPPCL